MIIVASGVGFNVMSFLLINRAKPFKFRYKKHEGFSERLVLVLVLMFVLVLVLVLLPVLVLVLLIVLVLLLELVLVLDD